VSSLVAAGAAAKGVLALLAMLAVQGTVLALVAVAVTRLTRRMPAVTAAVWLVVLGKLALPWSPALPWSLADVIAWLRHGEAAAAITAAPIGAGAEPAAAAIYPSLGWLALAALWALGTIVVVGRAVIAHRITVAAARQAPLAPAPARALLAELAVAVRVRTPRLAIGGDDTGPHVVGVLRPIIVVPPALFTDEALLRAALLHELAHVRRKDALARIVQIWATAMFFWLPVVRLVARRLDLAREAACDAWALEASSLSRPAYARLLVKMAGLRTAAAPSLSSPRTLDARIAAVLGPPARARIGIFGKLGVLAFAVVAAAGASGSRPRWRRHGVQGRGLRAAGRVAPPGRVWRAPGVHTRRDRCCPARSDPRRAAVLQLRRA
jgi:beta-lactamase regulating signal transducer with metallopeptidase domain